MTFYAGHHSNQLIPIFAKGTGSELLHSYADEQDFVRGKFLNNSEIGQAMFTLWNGKPCTLANNKPIIISKIPNITLYLQKDTTFVLNTNFISDIEDSELTFNVGTRPTWLTFDSKTLTFSGKPTALTNTKVKVIVTDGKTTGASISVEALFTVSVVADPTSIQKTNKQNVEAYPNPAYNKLIVTTPSGKGEIYIRTIEGQVVESREITATVEEFNVSKLSAGVYILEINDTYTKTQQTIIIK